ncbi:MAG TPA: hypothetical protein VJ201_03070 [Candidatus Babeliales bacterium]|nr:hypothetical protein [Candidatus Babeliales bacterium]
MEKYIDFCLVVFISLYGNLVWTSHSPHVRGVSLVRRPGYIKYEDSAFFILSLEKQILWLECNCRELNDSILNVVLRRTQMLIKIGSSYDQKIIEKLHGIHQLARQTYTELEHQLEEEDRSTPIARAVNLSFLQGDGAAPA